MIAPNLASKLLHGELADLALYESLRVRATGRLARTLDAFIATERVHAAFWRDTFGLSETRPNAAGRFRNVLIRVAVRLFGERAAFLMLEAVETHGIQKYLELWEQTEDPALRDGLRRILTDELLHEDEAATGGDRAVDPGVIRNAFLGFNDGSVEILGAVSGLAAALGNPSLVAVAALTVSVAGSVSMAAGAYLSTHSEAELMRMEAAKQSFLAGIARTALPVPSPWRAARVVGAAYLVGAAMPVLPFLLGAHSPLWSIFLSGTLILMVSAVLAFLSGMDVRKRIALNVGVVIAAVLVSYAFGRLADSYLGA